LWFSKPHDFAEYKQRRASVKTTVQHVFALRVLSLFNCANGTLDLNQRGNLYRAAD
jgi:hypothetical protein